MLNIGSGKSLSILEVAEQMARALGIDDLPPEVTRKYRTGDIRHCFADIELAHEVLGYRPQVDLADGLEELVEWMLGQNAFDRVEDASAELSRRGLQR
ncbi:NAD-dependent epimerase/dehydratase family protein [Novilysobacter viscosus]|uniref:NAD-dependent epimerase/dehydratase family protein n=1 Tax=Novilysobacter viscosus TaxID=3098602 RepID=UPI003F885CD7